MTEQTRMGSFSEAVINVFIGFWINFAANLVILPLFGFASLTLHDNLLIGLIYTAISIVRSYTIRRLFSTHITRAAHAMARATQRKP